MSDTASPVAAVNGSSPQFSERELQLLGWAMQSLKSGPPDIDYDKLAAFASMTNSRSASNAWLKLKKKLITDGDAPPSTPVKKAPKKAATPARKKKTAETTDDDGESPKKPSPRKRPAKKQEVEDGEASPKKKGRSAKSKKSEATVDESDETETSSADLPVKTEAKAETSNDDLDDDKPEAKSEEETLV